MVNAQVVHIAEIQQAQAVNKASTAATATTNTNKRSPFLSTTLSTKITFASSPPSSLQPLDDGSTTLAAQKSILSEALTHFYTKIFSDQTAYNIKIISVVLFNDHVLSSNNKNGQPVDVITQQQSQHHDDDDNGDGGNEHTISYTTVISGEYTTTSSTTTTSAIQNQNQMISNDEFHNMLIHVSTKFQGHLLKYLHDVVSSTSSSAKNLNLRNVRSVVLDDFERIVTSSSSSTSSSDALEIMGMSMTTSTVHIVSIIAIVISALVFVMLSIATVRYHK